MGRPPCCEKVGIKKGPWTPEEDIILVSYIQEHGPGNWRSVPTNTGLLRCSKSCRLRWTNYLRPGIKRGNFTQHEERTIIRLQALMGNRWAAIATYLPQRTDNDIKNFWNTHLKKKIKKFQAGGEGYTASFESTLSYPELKPKGYNMETRNQGISTIHSSLPRLHHSPSTYASSTENISRLLEGWMRSSPRAAQDEPQQNNTPNNIAIQARVEQGGFDPISHEELESLLSFENLRGSTTNHLEAKQELDDHHSPPLSFLEKWLLDEVSGQAEELMELSADSCSNVVF